MHLCSSKLFLSGVGSPSEFIPCCCAKRPSQKRLSGEFLLADSSRSHSPMVGKPQWQELESAVKKQDTQCVFTAQFPFPMYTVQDALLGR